MRFLSMLLVGAGIVLGAPSRAEPWQALVVAQTGPQAERAFDASFRTIQALELGGLSVEAVRNRPRADLLAAIDAVAPGTKLLLYYAGRTPGSALTLEDGSIAVVALLDRLAAAGVDRAALLVDNCASAAPSDGGFFVPDGAPLDLTVHAVGTADRPCPTGDSIAARLDAEASAGTLAGPLAPLLAGFALGPGSDDPVILPGLSEAPATGLDIIVIETVDPATGQRMDSEVLLPALDPVYPPADRGDAPAAPQVILASLPDTRIVARPLREGLPQPSIVVGLLPGIEPEDATPEPPDEPSVGLSYTNRDGWESLREADPAFFASLVNAGAIDPPATELALASQIELRAMNCYRGGLDNDWGPGSRRGAESFYAELGREGPPFRDPSVDLFRFVVINATVECPAPVAARPRATAPSAPARTQPAPQPSRPATTTRSTPAPANNPPSGGSGGNRGGSMVGVGIF